MNTGFRFFEIRKIDEKVVATCLKYPIGDAGGEGDLLDNEIDALLQLEFESFVLDLRQVEKVDGGRFANRMMRIYKSLDALKSLRLKVCLNDTLQELFELTGFDKIFDIVECD